METEELQELNAMKKKRYDRKEVSVANVFVQSFAENVGMESKIAGERKKN